MLKLFFIRLAFIVSIAADPVYPSLAVCRESKDRGHYPREYDEGLPIGV